MWHYLENLRKKPESVRRSITISVAGGVTAVVLVLWFTTNLFSFFNSPETAQVREDNASTKEENVSLASPFASFTEGVSGLYEMFSEEINGMKETFEESVNKEVYERVPSSTSSNSFQPTDEGHKEFQAQPKTGQETSVSSSDTFSFEKDNPEKNSREMRDRSSSDSEPQGDTRNTVTDDKRTDNARKDQENKQLYP